MNIRAFMRPCCGWADDVRVVLRKYSLIYEEIDIDADSEARAEMERLTGQVHSPCVEVNGVMLADVYGEALEDYLLNQHLVKGDGVFAGAQVSRGVGTRVASKQVSTQTIRFF